MALEHLDYSSLKSLQEVMADDFPLLIETFITDSDMRLDTIRDAVQDSDPEAIRRTAHSLKGSASNMGALELTRLCRELEDLGHSGRSEGAGDIYAAVVIEYAQVKEALQKLL